MPTSDKLAALKAQLTAGELASYIDFKLYHPDLTPIEEEQLLIQMLNDHPLRSNPTRQIT